MCTVNPIYFQFKNGKEKSSVISIVVTAIIDFLSETNCNFVDNKTSKIAKRAFKKYIYTF